MDRSYIVLMFVLLYVALGFVVYSSLKDSNIFNVNDSIKYCPAE